MNRVNKVLTIILTVLLMCCMSWAFVGCKDRKYDVTIRIACDDGETWVFTPDVDEIRIERDYDGQEHKYYIDAYQLSEKPGWEDKWISPDGEGANVFHVNLAYQNESGQVTEIKSKRISERGLYCMHINASGTSDLWNERTVLLYITVK